MEETKCNMASVLQKMIKIKIAFKCYLQKSLITILAILASLKNTFVRIYDCKIAEGSSITTVAICNVLRFGIITNVNQYFNQNSSFLKQTSRVQGIVNEKLDISS